MPSPTPVLERHPKDGVRAIALDLLTQADAARERLDDPSDAEALHDFRVAIRRLRSTERAFRAELAESVTKRARARLRRVAQATNGGRDAEVQIEWVEAQRPSLYSRHRPGATWFRDRLRKQKLKADAKLHDEVKRDYDRVAGKLRRALPCYTLEHRVGESSHAPRFADALAARVREAAIELSLRLDEVTGPAASDAAHEARIAAKRLRYLLEPASASIDGVKDTVRELKRLQDALGELHDLDVVSAALAHAIADFNEELESTRATEAPATPTSEHDGSAPEHPPRPIPAPAPPASLERDPRPGLACLARRARTRREALFTELADAWFAGAAAAFLARVERTAQAIAAPHASPVPNDGAPREIERKYLLRALPPRALDVAPDEIEQGWLPGETLIERLRRTRVGSAERYFRTVKLGSGVSRVEVEEETTAELFAALWPLTESRRIAKQRHKVTDGTLVWEIDDFPALDLAVAEVELPDAELVPTPPDWLLPYVVREVTEEKGFTNYELAAHGVPSSEVPPHGSAPRGHENGENGENDESANLFVG